MCVCVDAACGRICLPVCVCVRAYNSFIMKALPPPSWTTNSPSHCSNFPSTNDVVRAPSPFPAWAAQSAWRRASRSSSKACSEAAANLYRPSSTINYGPTCKRQAGLPACLPLQLAKAVCATVRKAPLLSLAGCKSASRVAVRPAAPLPCSEAAAVFLLLRASTCGWSARRGVPAGPGYPLPAGMHYWKKIKFDRLDWYY